MQKIIRSIFILTIILALNHAAKADDFSSAVTKRISQKTILGTAESNDNSIDPRVSKNGRYVVFESTSTNLIPANFHGVPISGSKSRIFLYDRQADSLELISLTHDNKDIPTDAHNPSVSDDGRYVAYTEFVTMDQMATIVSVCPPPRPASANSSCHVNIPHAGQHIFIRDRIANDTMLATQITLTLQRQAEDANGVPQVFADANGNLHPQMEEVTGSVAARILYGNTAVPPYDCTNGATNMPPLGPNASPYYLKACPAVAADNTVEDIHEHPDSLSDNPRLSADGRYVVYDTDANNLTWAAKLFVAPSAGSNPWEYNSVTGIMNDPNFLFEPIGYYGDADYEHPRNQSLERYFGADADPTNNHLRVRDIYLRDGKDNTNQLVSFFCKYYEPGSKCTIFNAGVIAAIQDAVNPSISDDGNSIVFNSKTPFLALDFNDTDDIFLVQRSAINGEIANLERISNNTSRIMAGNGASTHPAISGDGRYIAYESEASDLVAGDTNGKSDIFIYDTSFFTTTRCSTTVSSQFNGDSHAPDITGSGQYVSFHSNSINGGSSLGTNQVYMAKINRNSNGSIASCTAELGSTADGNGANGTGALNSGIALVPQTKTIDGKQVRALRAALTYQSDATNLVSGLTDANGKIDIFQSPNCSEADRTTDTDGDGTVDCFDQCWKDPTKVEDIDSDGDGFADCEDGCPGDPQKQSPGICGCGVADIDSDGDGTPDCKDLCPNDPNKIAPGDCGCGIPDLDTNHNGISDCKESILPTPVPSPTPRVSPTPRATATPDYSTSFKNLIPKTPTLTARGGGAVLLTFSTSNVPSNIDVTGARACFTVGSGSTSSTNCRTTLGGVLRGFPRGRNVTVRVNLIGKLNGQNLLSRQSAASRSITIR